LKTQDILQPIFENSTERAHYLSYVIWASPGFVYIKDIHSKYIACNENFALAAGAQSHHEIIGKTDYDLPWGATEANFFRTSDIEILSGKVKVNFEEQQLQNNGKTHTLLANKIPLYDEHRNIIGIYGNYFDITDRKEREKSLLEAKRQAEESNIAQSENVVNISHDLRTPLAAILGMTEAALHSKEPESYKEALEGVLDSGKHLLTLVEDIQNNASAQHKAPVVEYAAFCLDHLISAIHLSMNSVAKQKGLDFTIDNECPKYQYIRSDRKSLRRIMTNLIGNAIKFTPTGSVQVTIYPGPPSQLFPNLMTLNITVKDTGIGMKKKDLGTIFGRFSRLAPTYITDHSSTGLGLTIVQQLLLDLNGKINVESELGSGTTFHCSIPLEFIALDEEDKAQITHDDQPVIDEEKEIQQLPAKKTSMAKVLVVEDSRPVRRAMRMLLKHLNTDVSFAFSAEDALKISINEYDIILMDISLGDTSGIEVTKQLRKKHGNRTPIIALTAHSQEKNRQLCLAAGMDNYLTKPIRLELLRELFRSYHLIP
jgi:signal transduction histidine kinase/CheY-like chemotaxis protein